MKIERSPAVYFSLLCVVFYINALGVGSRWKDLFGGSPDRPLLTIHLISVRSPPHPPPGFFSRDLDGARSCRHHAHSRGSWPRSRIAHLQVQYALLARLLSIAASSSICISNPRAFSRADAVAYSSCSRAAFYLTAKCRPCVTIPAARDSRPLCCCGQRFLSLLLWFGSAGALAALAFVAFAVLLSRPRAHCAITRLPGTRIFYRSCLFTALTADPSGVHVWHTIPVRAFSALPVLSEAIGSQAAWNH